jgi:type II secretory pathway pseudopilin PulG
VTGADAPLPKIRCRRERGYALLAMLLFVSLLVVTLAAVAPSIARQIRRDQETELIHREMQYRRAIRQFTKKTGRFPMKIEDLENTNGVRYLRKRYKDPVTGGEFRLLHMADIPAATGTSSNAWSVQPGAAPNDSFDSSTSPPGQDPLDGATAKNPQAAAPDKSAAPGAPQSGPSIASSANNSFGGGVIVGVASSSKKKTIREFDRRDHYNQWLFFYDPGFERPFEVQGPTPTTHPPVALQSAPNSPGTAPNSSNNAPSSSSQNAQPSPP